MTFLGEAAAAAGGGSTWSQRQRGSRRLRRAQAPIDGSLDRAIIPPRLGTPLRRWLLPRGVPDRQRTATLSATSSTFQAGHDATRRATKLPATRTLGVRAFMRTCTCC